MAQQANKRRYVFHFDLNCTTIMRDERMGLGPADMVSESEESAILALTITLTVIFLGLPHSMQECMGQNDEAPDADWR